MQELWRMKISDDAEIDALYIRLLEGRQECRSVRLSDEVALNIGTPEKPVSQSQVLWPCDDNHRE